MLLRLIASLTTLCLLLAAGGSRTVQAETEPPPPSFRAGASIALGVTVHAPELWVINPGVPFRVSFDQEALKTAPYKIDKAVQDFTLKNYAGHIYIELPVRLSEELGDGELSIPFQIDCGICTADQESCTFSSGTATVKLLIQNQPLPGIKTSALKKGMTPAVVHLPLP